MSGKMPNFEDLSNQELRIKCLEYGLPNIPVNDFTRQILLRRLRAATTSSHSTQEETLDVLNPGGSASTSKKNTKKNNEDNEVDNGGEGTVKNDTAKMLSSLRPPMAKKIAASTSAPKVGKSISIPAEDGPSSNNNAVTGKRVIALKWKGDRTDESSDSDESTVNKVTAKMTLTPTSLSDKTPFPNPQTLKKNIASTSPPKSKLPTLDERPSCSKIAEKRAKIGQRKSAYVDTFSDNDETSTPMKKTSKRSSTVSANESSQIPQKLNKTTDTAPSTNILRTKETKRKHTNVASGSNEEDPVKNAKAKKSDISKSSPKIISKKSTAAEERPSTSNIPVPARSVPTNESKGVNTDDEPAKTTTATMKESSTKFSAEETGLSTKPSVSKRHPKSPVPESSAQSKMPSKAGNVSTSYREKLAALTAQKTYSFAAPAYIESSEELNNRVTIKPTPVSTSVSKVLPSNAIFASLSSSGHRSSIVSSTPSCSSSQSFTSAKYRFIAPSTVFNTYGRLPSNFSETITTTTSSNTKKFNDDADLLSEEDEENETVVIPFGSNIETPNLREFPIKLQELKPPPLRHLGGSAKVTPPNAALLYENMAYRQRMRAGYIGAGASASPGSCFTESDRTADMRGVLVDSAGNSQFLNSIISLNERYYIQETIIFILFLIMIVFAFVFF